MTNNNKKYEMGGAVQSFSSPMLAQGMQGGLSGFGTSGLGMFANGGQIKGSNTKTGEKFEVVTGSLNQLEEEIGEGNTQINVRKFYGSRTSEMKLTFDYQGNLLGINDYGYSLDGLPNLSASSATGYNADKKETLQILSRIYSPSFAKKLIESVTTKMADGGQISDIERILAKYRAIASNKPKEDKTSEFLNKSWEGKNLDDYIMYSDRYNKGGEVPSIGDSGTITDKNSMFLGKMATITADLGNMYEVRVGERTTIVKKNGINIVSDQYADGGEVNKYEATFDQLKKGDVVTLKFGSSISRENDVKLIVKSKNLVGKGKTYESEKITFAQANNPTGVKFYAYKRKSGYIGFASGDMGINVTSISIENKFEHGGSTSHSNNGKINGQYLDSLSEIKQRRILMNVANHYEISLEEANDEVRDEEAELLYEYIADDNTLKMSIYYQFQDNMNKYAGGGEFEEEESMDVQFIEYNGNEIMYEPIMKKYYANDVEFDTLKEAQKFLDSGEMSDSIRGAYARGLYEKGGELKKPTWIAIYEKGRERKVFELGANSREEAKIEAEKGKKQYKIPEEMFLYDVYRKFAHGGEVSSAKNYLYEISTPFPVSNLVEELEELFGPGRVILNDWNSPEQLESVAMLNLTKNDINKIQSNLEDAIISKSEITNPEEMEMLNHYAKGGEVDRISIGDNVYAYFAQNYVGYQLVESPSMGEPYDGKVIEIINENNQKKYVVKFENGETKKLSQGIFDDYVIKEKFAQGGEVDESLKNAYRDLKNQISDLKLHPDAIENSIECSVRDWGNWEHDYEDSYRDNFEDDDFMILSSNSIKKLNEIVKAIETKNPNVSINWDISEKNYIDFFISRKMAQGGKIGFEGLAKKVAKRYKGKAVSKEYQAEYGKTYDAKEAKEVGNKVAAKVYRQQVAKKKIVRKLQRKTN